MAEGINPLILPIGADVSQFKYSVNDVKIEYKALSDLVKSIPFNLVKPEDKKELEDLSRTIKVLEGDLRDVGEAAVYPANSIKGITDRIQELKGKKIIIDADASQQEILQLNQEIQELEERLVKLNALGKKDSFSNISNSSKQARVSLTNLSLVAQDLPFGFIAIQNNIPNLIQSFAKLSEEAKQAKVSVGSQLAAEFKGTAGAILGIGLAVSVAVSAVTVLIQKYGSLGAAFDAFFGKINPLQNELNRASKLLEGFGKNYISVGEAIASANTTSDRQIVKLEALGQIVLDVTKTEKARKSALEELKTIDEDRFGRYDVESGKLKGLTNDIQLYTNVVLAKATAEKLADRSAEALAVRESERNKYGQLLKQLDNLKKEFPNVEKAAADYQVRIEDYLNAIKKGKSQGLAPIAEDEVKKFNDLSSEIRITGNNLTKLNDTYSESRIVLKEATLEALAFGNALNDANKNGKSFQLSIDAQNLEAAFDLDTIISNLTKYGNALLDTSKSELERKDAIQKLIDINPEYFKGLSTEKSGLTVVKGRVEELIKNYQILKREREFAARASKINAELFKNEQKGLGEKIDLSDKYNLVPEVKPIKIEDLIDQSFDLEKIAKPIKSLRDFQTELDITGAILNYKTNITSLGEVYKLTFSELVEKNKELASSIQGFLYQPLENIFDILLEKGKKSWKEFGNSIIATLKRIAAQIAATFIAKGIANILAPGLGSISKGALGEWLGQDFNDITGGFAMNDIRPGGMQMSGQVVFVQRGSDLVGVLNRTNGTINRVG